MPRTIFIPLDQCEKKKILEIANAIDKMKYL